MTLRLPLIVIALLGILANLIAQPAAPADDPLPKGA